MKQFFFGLLACAVVTFPAQAADVVDPDAMGLGLISQEAVSPPSHDPSLCLDGMEMEPWTDDLVPMPTSMDGGCSVSGDAIAT